MKFAIIGNNYQSKKAIEIESVLRILNKYDAEVFICADFYRFLTEGLHMKIKPAGLFCDDNFSADMVISIGGDGTFLRAARHTGAKNIPILGVNTGRLGFLADATPSELENIFYDIHQGNYTIEERSVLEITTDPNTHIPYPFALNEIAVLKRDSCSMISIHTCINGAFMNTYQADGLIIATPTGSTAYSLSVNGPIIAPNSNSIAITPVAPHSLNVRPVVICDDCELTLDVKSRSHNFLVAIDGKSYTCKQGTRLTIRKAPYTVKVVKQKNHNFFDSIRTKLMWGADRR